MPIPQRKKSKNINTSKIHNNEFYDDSYVTTEDILANNDEKESDIDSSSEKQSDKSEINKVKKIDNNSKDKVITPQKITREEVKQNDREGKKKRPIIYSTKARKDGYNFSNLTDEEQEITRYFYFSENAMSNLYLIQMTEEEINTDYKSVHLNYGWGFPASGYYYGLIINAKNIDKSHRNEAMIDLLVNSSDVIHIKFNKSFNDPIYRELITTLNISDNIFHPLDLSGMIGCYVAIMVENIVTSAGKDFSVPKYMKLIDMNTLEALNNIIGEMFRQAPYIDK